MAQPSPEQYLDSIHNPPRGAPFSRLAALSDEERLLVEWNMRRVALARESPKHFFGYVMREETTRVRIVTLPHQRVLFDFVRHYPFTVLRLPVGFSKSFCMTGLTLWQLGKSKTTRGAFISSSEDQASKPLLAVRSYIEDSPELRLVYPQLLPTQRDGEPWTQTAITIDRPYGIRDPSCVALGLDSKRLPGSRLNWANVDDILDEQNTSTAEQRRKVNKWVLSTVVTRLGEKGARCCVTNTPWHPEDVTYELEKIGWPSCSMDAWGNVFFKNADDFDSPDIRPSLIGGDSGVHRLVANDRRELIEQAAEEMRAGAL